MKKIIISIIVIGLLLSTSVVSVNVVSSKACRPFIYVDDDADLDWYDETHVKTIKEGIAVAEDGDTVFVYGGVYNQYNIEIDKSINLIGEDRNITKVKVRRGVRITADRVSFSGFTISDISFSEWMGVTCIDIWYSASYCTVSGNTFSNLSGGEDGRVTCIRISDASYCIVSDNTISNINGKRAYGIDISDASYCIVSDNTISNISGKYASGILIIGHAEPAAHNTIRGNTIKDISSPATFAWGISVMDESHLHITGNTISNIRSGVDTGGNGIYIYSPYGSRYNLIEGNTITDCNYCCIFLVGGDSYGYAKFTTIKNNTIKGRWPDDRNIGISLGAFVTDTTISKNTIESNSRGLYISIECKNNVVSKNIFNYNAEGIAMGRGNNLIGYSSRNKIIANNIENTTNYGIYCEDGSKNNEIHHNNLINNGKHAYDVGISNNWDDGSEGNYWDDYTGQDSDGDGIGDTPYEIDGKELFPSKDHFPFMEPVDIENVEINFDMTGEESSQSQQSTKQSYPSSQPISQQQFQSQSTPLSNPLLGGQSSQPTSR